MANAFYRKGAEKIIKAEINLLTNDIKAVLLKNTYTPNLSAHEFYADVVADIVGSPVALANKSVGLGVFDADNTTFASVPSGHTANYIAIFKNTGVDATSPLLALIDTATNLPATTNGGDIKAQWDDGANKILSL